MNEKTKKRLLYGGLIYAALFLFTVSIINLPSFNAWLGKVLTLLRPLIIGLVLAYLCNPFFRFFERKMLAKVRPSGLRRAIALFFTYLVVLLIISVLLILLIPQLIDSIKSFLNNYNAYFYSTMEQVNSTIVSLNGFLDGMNVNFDIPSLDAEWAKEKISAFLTSIHLDQESLMKLISFNSISQLVNVAEEVISIVIDTVFGFFISLYLLSSKEKRYAQIMRFRRAFFSDAVNETVTRVCETVNRSFGGFFRGKILDSALIGFLVYIVISIFDVPYAVLIAVIIGITDIVPIIGPFIGVIPSAVIILLTDPGKVILFLLCILAIQQIDGNIIAPKILGENTGVSSLAVLITITTMGSLWGLAGMLLGVPLFATVAELGGYYLNRRLIKKGLPVEIGDYYGAGSAANARTEENEENIVSRIKRKMQKLEEDKHSGELTRLEKFQLDTYALACKYHIFSDDSEEALKNFAAEEAALRAKETEIQNSSAEAPTNLEEISTEPAQPLPSDEENKGENE